MPAIKRGYDKPVNIKRVRHTASGDLLPDAIISWKFYNRADEELASGVASLFDASEAWFQFMIPKLITDDLDLFEHYRLDIIYAHSGKEIAYSYELVAVDFYAPN